MFSANENITLRQDKRRIVGYVEETIPEEALDLGTSVMVMQMTCREPGCVPLETAIAIVFPRNVTEEIIPGVRESGPNHGGGKGGGTFKTRIMMPLAQVTKEDVLDALPPGFEGGRKTWESTCLALRDAMFGRMGQMFGNANDDYELDEAGLEENRLVARYLIECLNEYMENGCKPPEYGKPYPEKENDEKDTKEEELIDSQSSTQAQNLVVEESNESTKLSNTSESNATTSSVVVKGSMAGKGNFTIRRTPENDKDGGGIDDETTQEANTDTTPIQRQEASPSMNAMEWRRQENMSKSIQLPNSSSRGIIQQLSEREHAPGVRSPGCPCCDPEALDNIIDSMLM